MFIALSISQRGIQLLSFAFLCAIIVENLPIDPYVVICAYETSLFRKQNQVEYIATRASNRTPNQSQKLKVSSCL